MSCESVSRVSILMFLTFFEVKLFLIVMEYTEIAKSRGKLYACENQLYIQHSIKKGIKYLKCINEDFTATAKVMDSRLHAIRPHNQQDDQNTEIERLQVLERCRKRTASSSTNTLRAIFNGETRAASSSVSDNVSFVAVQSSMYKCRRKALPALPTHAEDVPEAVAETRYATLNASVFFVVRSNQMALRVRTCLRQMNSCSY